MDVISVASSLGTKAYGEFGGVLVQGIDGDIQADTAPATAAPATANSGVPLLSTHSGILLSIGACDRWIEHRAPHPSGS